ncbi:hypothetical protein [Brucella thiophenivorans]|uniref:Putative lipoprotein n=1 Tax=Brucella thiophenivorans TaxID=571255 RepID=A0A256FDV6_9HYPH|nr:hypothetical protein [Brucella thiophenivorans]OYR13035.1 putative lipoprotein [Brucella thiophenivorans]
MKRFIPITLSICAVALVTACTTNDASKGSSSTPIATATQEKAAPKLVDSYTAHISEKDKVDNKGVKLTDAKAILLQDRRNYYDFNLRDKGDTPSKVFASKENRWGEGKPISEMKWEPVSSRHPEKGYQWKMRQGVEYEIIEGNPDLTIQIYNDGNIHVDQMQPY